MSQKLVSNFAGMDTTSPQGSSPPLRMAMGITIGPGPAAISKVPSNIVGTAVQPISLTRFIDPAGISYIVYQRSDGNVYAVIEGGAASLIGTASATACRFAQFDGKLFWTNGTGALQVWLGNPLTSAYNTGMPAPNQSPVTVSGGAGKLDSLNKVIPLYQYYYTFLSSDGVESNPQPFSVLGAGYAAHNEQIDFSVTRLAAYYSRIAAARIYRRGGVTTGFYFVAETAVQADTGIYPNNGFLYTDNIADIDQSDELVSFARSEPPVGLTCILTHNRRLYGAKGTRIYFSGLETPEEFGSLATGSSSEGGYITLDGGMDDEIVGLSSVGNVLIILRKRSIDALYGNSFDDFSVSKRFTVGVAGRFSYCMGAETCFFLGNDGRVYAVSDGGLNDIGRDVQATLDALTSAQKSLCKMAFADNRLMLAFETGPASPDDVCLIFNTLFKAWTCESGMLVSCLTSAPNPTTGIPEFLFASYGIPTIKRAFATTGRTKFRVTLGEAWNNGVGRTRTALYRHYIEGSLDLTGVPDGVKPRVQLYTDLGASVSVFAPVGVMTGVIANGRMAAGLTGRYLYMSLYGEAVSGYINQMSNDNYLLRMQE